MYGLPLLHKGPFRRMLVAQAVAEDLTLVTPDGAIRITRSNGCGESWPSGMLARDKRRKLMPPEPTALCDFARRYTAAWCSQDAPSVATFYSPAGSLSVNCGAPAARGEPITEVAQSFISAFPDLEGRMCDLLVQSNCAVYHSTLAGPNTLGA